MVGELCNSKYTEVKVRTFDNLFVRLPNESMIKTQVTILTRFPKRRADLKIGIAYKEDIEIPFPHISLYSGTATKPMPIVMDRENNETS
jgi:small-conductance mechanosensitive channel